MRYQFPNRFPAPSHEDLKRIRNGCRLTADRLIRSCEPKLHLLAHRHETRTCNADCLVQAGRIAVWRASTGYSPDIGPFDNYATRAVINAFHDALTEDGDQTTDALSDLIIDRRSPEFSRADCQRMRRAVRSLRQIEFDILFLVYGCGYTERLAGSFLGLSQPRINQIRRRALDSLGAAFNGPMNN